MTAEAVTDDVQPHAGVRIPVTLCRVCDEPIVGDLVAGELSMGWISRPTRFHPECFCKHQDVSPERLAKQHAWRNCWHCGRRWIPYYSQRGNYCSDACRKAFWRDYVRRSRGPAECVLCGNTYTPTRTDAKYCSSVCRQRAYRERRPR